MPVGTVTAFRSVNLLSATVLCLVAGVLASLLFRRLASRHSDTWTALGSPTLFVNSSIRIQGNVRRFIWSAVHRRLNDNYVTRLVIALRAVIVALGALFVVTVILSFTWRGVPT